MKVKEEKKQNDRGNRIWGDSYYKEERNCGKENQGQRWPAWQEAGTRLSVIFGNTAFEIFLLSHCQLI